MLPGGCHRGMFDDWTLIPLPPAERLLDTADLGAIRIERARQNLREAAVLLERASMFLERACSGELPLARAATQSGEAAYLARMALLGIEEGDTEEAG